MPSLALLWASALAGPYDTTELVVLGQPIPVVLTWRPEQTLTEGLPNGPVSCVVSVTAQDSGGAVFNTSDCQADNRVLVDRALRRATALPVEELGWGLKTWTTTRVTLSSQDGFLAMTLLPGGTGQLPELHHSEITVREYQEPTYPPDAKWRGVPGSCSVHLQVDEKGRPFQLEPVRCTSGFEDTSLEALKQWRFKPYRVDGQPQAFDTIMTLNYNVAPPTPADQDPSP